MPTSALIGLVALASAAGVGAETPAPADPMHHKSSQADSTEASWTAGVGADGGAAWVANHRPPPAIASPVVMIGETGRAMGILNSTGLARDSATLKYHIWLLYLLNQVEPFGLPAMNERASSATQPH